MKTRICPKCKKEKSLFEFYKWSYKKNGFGTYCKICKSNIDKKYRLKYPAKAIFADIQKRCYNKNSKSYKTYGGRGIKNYLILKDIEFLMKRDNYYKLKKPTIDRKDNDGNYTLENCRFIERKENSARRFRKEVYQFEKNGKFIKKWNSLMDVERKLSFSNSHLSACCIGKLKTAYKFIWKYRRF